MQLSLLGEVRDDFTSDDVRAYTGSLPLPRRILNAVKMIQVSKVQYNRNMLFGNVFGHRGEMNSVVS
jgi:hypothetical protein